MTVKRGPVSDGVEEILNLFKPQVQFLQNNTVRTNDKKKYETSRDDKKFCDLLRNNMK